jgi:uncharacterized protein YdcH (DUF465 family)
MGSSTIDAHFRQLVDDQDRVLDEISKDMESLRIDADNIGHELRHQHHILAETIDEVDQVDPRLRSVTKKVQNMYTSLKGCSGQSWIIFACIIILIVLAAVVLFT